MSYQQKVIENGNNEDDPRKTSLTSRPNIKELTHKQRNWFSSFEKNRSEVTSVDSVRRTSVKNDHTPNLLSGSGSTTGSSPQSLPPDATPTPPSNLNTPRDRRPLSASLGLGARGGSTASDSIEAYLQNWKKSESPLSSPSSYESGRYVIIIFRYYFLLFLATFLNGNNSFFHSFYLACFDDKTVICRC